jgi:hypothetical protein
MLRQRSLLIVALGTAACAQIAGFDDLSSKRPSSHDAAGAAGNAATAGGSSSSAGSNGVGGHASNAGGTRPTDAPAGDDPTGGVGGGSGASAAAGKPPTAGTPPTAGGGGGGAGGNAAGAAGEAPEVTAGCNEEQLVNGSFDAGASGWQVDASTVLGITELSDVIVDKRSDRLPAGVAPESGDYLAWLGNRPNSQQGTRITLFQPIDIPDAASHFTLTVSIRIRTAETAAAVKSSRDQVDIALDMFDPNDERYWSFHYWPVSKGVATDEWQSLTYDVDEPSWIEELRGQRMRFKAESQSDIEGETTFWIDSLSFVAYCN